MNRSRKVTTAARLTYLIFLLLLLVCPGEHHDHECHEKCADGLKEFDLNYTQTICQGILPLHCGHVHYGHEVNDSLVDVIEHQHVCGTDDDTYTHCEFAQLRCRYLYPNMHGAHGGTTVDLQIKNYGTCDKPVTTTTRETPPPHTTTTAPMTTVQPIVASTPPPTAVPPASTTVSNNHIHDLMAGVFCANKDVISCNNGVNIVCGNDGQFYPNVCELTKAACTKPSLDIADDQSPCLP